MISENTFKIKENRQPYKGCYCRNPELIENYDLAISDTENIWECHHRLETHTSDGEKRLVNLKAEELIALGVYYDRPPEELIFLKRSYHLSLHHKGKVYNEKTRNKISKARLGKPGNCGFKGKHHSEESKRKNGDSLLEFYKKQDETKYHYGFKIAPRIYGLTNEKISQTLRTQRSVYVEFDEPTPWGNKLTTRQIAELNGSNQSGAVKQYINKYGYIIIRHTRYKCHIV